jgi:hypothetical protein
MLHKVNVPQLFSTLQIRQRSHEQGAVSEHDNHFDKLNNSYLPPMGSLAMKNQAWAWSAM